jgi:hypothetical protein
MDRTLREHISQLEERLKRLTEESMADRITIPQLYAIEAEIRVVNSALNSFRDAMRFEGQLPKT